MKIPTAKDAHKSSVDNNPVILMKKKAKEKGYLEFIEKTFNEGINNATRDGLFFFSYMSFCNDEILGKWIVDTLVPIGYELRSVNGTYLANGICYYKIFW